MTGPIASSCRAAALRAGITVGGQHQVGEGLSVLRVSRSGIDREPDQLPGSSDSGADQASPCVAFDPAGRQLPLRSGQLLLHLLSLGKQTGEVGRAFGHGELQGCGRSLPAYAAGLSISGLRVGQS